MLCCKRAGKPIMGMVFQVVVYERYCFFRQAIFFLSYFSLVIMFINGRVVICPSGMEKLQKFDGQTTMLSALHHL
jgi:hypothetical protein